MREVLGGGAPRPPKDRLSVATGVPAAASWIISRTIDHPCDEMRIAVAERMTHCFSGDGYPQFGRPGPA